MEEETLYAKMIEMPQESCNITVKHPKKKLKSFFKKQDVKEAVLEKVNGEVNADVVKEANANSDSDDTPAVADFSEDEETSTTVIKKKQKRFKISVIGIQVTVICLLLGVILFSNFFMKDSGIASFLNSVFAKSQAVDERDYSSFNPYVQVNSAYTFSDGVMNLTGRGSIYSPCDGTISSVTRTADGKFDIEVNHSAKFKSVYKGIDYAYFAEGDDVYANIPIGYSLGDNVELCFYSGEEMITDYTVQSGTVVWEV